MKKLIISLSCLFLFSSISLAQRSFQSSGENPRYDRKFAITSEGGWKTMTGTGINATYYVLPQLALDAGAGISFQGLRTGVRARYLFLDERFSPIIGLGVNMSNGTIERTFTQDIEPFEIDGQMIDGFTTELTVKLRRTYAAQILTGFEFMADGGFVVGLNLGYRSKLNQSWDTEFSVDDFTFDIADGILNSLDRVFGSGLSIGLNLGYAF